MNNINGILAREFIHDDSKLNILWTHVDNKLFTNLITGLSHTLLSTDDLYFMNKSPQLIVCNDIISSYQKIQLISLQFHLPIIIIDHQPPDQIIDNSKLELISKIPCSYRIAINKLIFESWNKIHDDIISIDNNSKQLWKQILINTSKRIYSL
jgi:hypothetical protein